MNKALLEALIEYKAKCESKGLIPTIDLMIEDMKNDIEMENEAKSLSEHND